MVIWPSCLSDEFSLMLLGEVNLKLLIHGSFAVSFDCTCWLS